MSACTIHELVLQPGHRQGDPSFIHTLSDKPPAVADFECPSCGLKLFVYYRVVPGGKAIDEQQEERNTK